MSRRRTPSDEDMDLWEKVTETVAPLERRLPKTKPAALPGAAPSKKKVAETKPVTLPPPPPAPKSPPGLAPMDRRTRSRLARGSVAIDRRIDLHGLTQAAAERQLERFLHDAQADGARVVLVITGKGRAGEMGGEERGVLRRMVPQWLAASALRSIVVGFEEAARNHGGGGALYVRIRRQRD